MNIVNLVEQLVSETTKVSLGHFGPELALCATIVAFLLFRLFNVDKWVPTYWVALGGTLAAFLLAGVQFSELRQASEPVSEVFFTGLLVYDRFTVFFRIFLLLFLVLVIALTVFSGIPDDEDSPDFYTLLLGSAVGMMIMASANNLLMLFVGVEMASVPSYVMVGFLKGKKKSSEAALKFVVYGAGAAGVMLYGTSLLAGLLGTTDMQLMAERLPLLFAGEESVGLSNPNAMALVMGIVMVMVGLAFKLSIFPFHFWCPDAFEGASAEVAGYLSVASKAAAFALLVRFCLIFVGDDPGALREVYLTLGLGVGVIAAITATFGNMSAYHQSNVKRLLAYSTIAHAGYMLMAVSALIVLLCAPADSGIDTAAQGAKAIEGLLYYLAVYLFMNLGAFVIVSLIRNEIYSEEIDDYNGLVERAPLLCVCMLVCLFSLVGLPPLGGFVGKFMIFASLYDATRVHPVMWGILLFGGLNTVLSLFYYLRVLKAMFLKERTAGTRAGDFHKNTASNFYMVVVTAPVLVLGIWIGRVSATVYAVASELLRS